MDPSVLLKDQELRKFHTLESMHHWSKIAPKSKFVICDGSGFDFSTILKQEFPHLQIECLSFMNDADLVKKHGKGFGEGEIIRYALDHSNYLKESNWFAKCTAKLWVENFQDCVLAWNDRLACKPFFSNVFSFRKMSLDYVDTRFYLVKKAFYLQYLSTAHIELGGDRGISIEDKYLDLIKEHDLRNIFMKNPPIIAGVGGGSARYYNTSSFRRIKEILRSRITSMNPRYRDFFIS
jgi:hypothetical protein